MAKKTEKTVVVSTSDLPVTFLVTSAFKGHLENLEIPETDLFVMTHMEHTSYGKGTRTIDELTEGAVHKAIQANGFTGKAGEYLLVHLPDFPFKHVLLVGLGKSGDVGRTTVCSLYRMIIDTAARIKAKKVTIPFFPGLLIDDVNYKGLLAVLHCRISERLRSGRLGELKEIEILGSSQARRHIIEGLKVDKQLCPVCRDPHFTSSVARVQPRLI